ncbi:MAG TPA: bifunctional phosphopantothenoylcysteine decarboxylase/phosphopantothenate--cysteine ligase CoaBC [Bacteroidia bacterium]|nr:bifunctional phosphopantothenoylcysteine decarboxylase/phosphopantothenate--cysteine ligase CoaBC [Bacteroidia bacterium]
MKGKKILLGITGGIAAYKCCNLVRLLIKNGAAVQVILTPDAADFVSPLTLSVLSKNPVLSTFSNNTGVWNNHVEIALQSDLFIIAPATANTIGKMANGICDNLLLATYFSAKCPIFFAPAMDLDMHEHPAIKKNIKELITYGNQLIPAENGELASGLVGIGRMAEPETIIKHIEAHFKKKNSLNGKKVLVTAGPTYEAIDPVRFIGNHSSGKMGIAIALAFANAGAEVILICGPNVQAIDLPVGVIRYNVQTAMQMHEACLKYFKNVDITIMSAAVADYRPAEIASQKIKKKNQNFELQLVKNPDILMDLGSKKTNKQLLIGFALETNNEVDHAKDKLKHKNLDMIVLNSLNDKGAGFGADTNKVTFIYKSKKSKNLPLMSKTEVAENLVDEILRI